MPEIHIATPPVLWQLQYTCTASGGFQAWHTDVDDSARSCAIISVALRNFGIKLGLYAAAKTLHSSLCDLQMSTVCVYSKRLLSQWGHCRCLLTEERIFKAYLRYTDSFENQHRRLQGQRYHIATPRLFALDASQPARLERGIFGATCSRKWN